MATGDFDGDGVLDLAVANQGSANVSVLLGNGDGSFLDAHHFGAGLWPNSVAVGDVNNDGSLDLAVANELSATVSVLLSNGDGTFQDAQNFPIPMTPSDVALGEFNGDGLLDLVVTSVTYVKFGTYGQMDVFLGNGNGTFQHSSILFDLEAPWSVNVVDFNDDGFQDIAMVDGVNFWVLLGLGNGTFQSRRFYAGSQVGKLAVGDFNNDGLLDLALTESGCFPCSTHLFVFLGNSDGTFQARRTFDVGDYPWSVVAEDVSGDGNLDLAVVISGGVRVLLGNGDGSFRTDPGIYRAGRAPLSMTAADFNGDGWPDLAVANSGSNDVSILLNDGDWSGGGGAPGGSPQPPPDIVPLLTADHRNPLPAQKATAVSPNGFVSETASLTPRESGAIVWHQPKAAALANSANRDAVNGLFKDFAARGWEDLMLDRIGLMGL